MTIKKITLLTKEEYVKNKSVIPKINHWCWLKTPCSGDGDYIHIVYADGDFDYFYVVDNDGGVRPLCVFDIEPDDPIFWYKSEMLVGSKIKYGKYEWTVLNAENSELYALCDEIIARRRFDTESNDWEDSELKAWLETEGLKLITV